MDHNTRDIIQTDLLNRGTFRYSLCEIIKKVAFLTKIASWICCCCFKKDRESVRRDKLYTYGLKKFEKDMDVLELLRNMRQLNLLAKVLLTEK